MLRGKCLEKIKLLNLHSQCKWMIVDAMYGMGGAEIQKIVISLEECTLKNVSNTYKLGKTMYKLQKAGSCQCKFLLFPVAQLSWLWHQ